MRTTLKSNHRPIDLTTDDLRAVIESVESGSAFWRMRATYAPSPARRRSATRWTYLFWAGPPSADIVPSLAITRHSGGYTVTIFDAMEFCASGSFETKECADLSCAIELVRQIITEAGELALDHAVPDVVALACCLAQIHRKPREAPSQRDTQLQKIILTLTSTDVLPS